MTVVQRTGQCGMDTFRIAKHLIVPEPQDQIALRFNYGGARCIDHLVVLPAVDLDDDAAPVTGEIDNVMPDGNLAAKSSLGEVLS